MTYSEPAFAKLNLCLGITGVRADGYHTISGVMCSVTLADTVTVDFDADETSLTCGDASLDVSEKNTVNIAAEEFYRALGRAAPPMKIHIDKRIPVAAGLGGGSSDAAAALRIFNRHENNPLSRAELEKIALRVGADVPFCLFGGIAVTEGVGELLTPLEYEKTLYAVVAVGAESVSSASAYREYDRLGIPPCGDVHTRVMRSAIASDGDISTSLYNVFERVIFPRSREPQTLKAKMLALGASGALMSGSGPSVFGLFPSEAAARSAADSLKSEGFRAFYCENTKSINI